MQNGIGSWLQLLNPREQTKMATIICDIDDTLLRNGTQPIRSTIDWLNSHSSYNVVIVTGRPASTRAKTVAALKAAGVKYDSLHMNPYSTSESNKWKAEMARKYHNAVLAIDNDGGARRAYSAEGIKSIHPNKLSDKTLTKNIWNGIFR